MSTHWRDPWLRLRRTLCANTVVESQKIIVTVLGGVCRALVLDARDNASCGAGVNFIRVRTRWREQLMVIEFIVLRRERDSPMHYHNTHRITNY